MWTIQGEAGKALDATVVPLAEIGAVAPKMVFRNLGVDSLTWQVMLAGLAPGSEILPQSGQTVTLYRAGTRFFHGHAAPPKQRGHVVTITVYGAWWWLERVFLESTQTDDTAATGERATFACPKQSLTTSLGSLLAAAIARGVPMAVGILAETFQAMEIRLNQLSFAQAIAEVARITPDIVGAFDYSASPPEFYTVRRKTGLATGSAVSLDLDAAAMEDFEINPLVELQLSQVKVPYLVRAADGGKQFASQDAGTASLGQVQLLTASGDEMDTFLPKDLLESVGVQSVFWSSADIAGRDSAIKSLVERYGNFGYGATTWFGSSLVTYSGVSTNKIPSAITFPPLVCKSVSGAVLPAGPYLVVSTDSLPEWAQKLLGAVEVNITGTFMVTEPYNGTSGWSALYGAMLQGSTSGGPSWMSGKWSINDKFYWLARQVNVTAWVIGQEYVGVTPVYRPSDYDFIFPPDGFADGLLTAQNYLAYEGSLTFREEDCGGQRYLHRAVNLTHSQTAHGSMRAMLSEEQLDLQTGVTTLQLGAPARFSYRDLVSRIRSNSNSNIVYV